MNNIWYLPGPFHQYRENVKALAKEAGLRIIDANATEGRDGEADRVPEVTLRQIESASVLVVGADDCAALQDLIDKLNVERDGIVLLIEAVESQSPIDHPGAGELPIRLYDALGSVSDIITSLAGERDGLATEAKSLREEVARLKAAINQASEDDDKVAALKAQLDKAGVTYRANASVESLEKAVADLPKA
ncbi:hypothetical protein FBY06_14431 [Pseudomonas sp. SJZ085]|uniref:hypothetical protein n=1 Tax=unclassified Pseudomonas TaxID=196821 RepID=UPI0011995AFC|nr:MULTISPECIES: hypothetical protein [unclassified Pseudomonas]TWC11442.1 hypothetical protein FBX99_14431 [Pseudomonas sp. SJZ074]TWC30044.1 hypothetical protein FBY06_14431 [Pseudomonas sp. SJZ085]